jgi:anti-sigma regulatory factor (Ser/Thr protein kinase)
MTAELASRRVPVVVQTRPLAWSRRCGAFHRLPADLAATASVRAEVARDLERHSWSSDDRARVLVCLTEALVNAVDHGSCGGGDVRVAHSVTETEVIARVVDEGPRAGEVPTGRSKPVPESSTHGRGMLMMRALTDDITIRPRVMGTELILRFGKHSASLTSRTADHVRRERRAARSRTRARDLSRLSADS